MKIKGKKTLKVAMVQGIFPHYREGIFSKLSEEYDFKLFHSSLDNGIPQKELHFSNKIGAFNFKSLKYLRMTLSLFKFRPDVIIHEFSLSLVNLYVCYLYSKITGCKFIVWGHGYDRKNKFDPKLNFADKVRAFFVESSDAVVLYSDDVQQLFQRTFDQKNIFVARNSIQSKEKDDLYNAMEYEGRTLVKARLGFGDNINIGFVARLTSIKKVLLLCDLVESFKLQGKGVTVHVVGDGEDFQTLTDAVRENDQQDNFILYGAIYDEAKVGEIIYASDFLVVPAWLGLTINHSFCYSTPVATLINEKHPPEIEFAQDGYNSVLSNTMVNMSQSIIRILDDKDTYIAMRANSRDYFVKNLGVESMFSGFEKSIQSAKLRGKKQ
ncbi:MAG: glycosyltransferase [Colwellia sp.]|jgi:Glycosyltransferase